MGHEVNRLYTACRACRCEEENNVRGCYVRKRNSLAWVVEEGLRGKKAGPHQSVCLGFDGAAHRPAKNS